MNLLSMRRVLLAVSLCLAASSFAARPWSGKIDGVVVTIPDLDRPVRAAFANGAPVWLPDDNVHWRAVATDFNAMQFSVNLDWRDPAASASRVLAVLDGASKAGALPVDHPEIRHAPLVLFGFSASSAAAARCATDPRLSNPDPSKPPQRVAAVIALDEIDIPPYIPPLSVPHLFMSDPAAGWPKHDIYGSLLTNVEDSKPPVTHDAYARARATDQGAPLTVISMPGHTHGGNDYGMNNEIDYRFLRVWLEEVLKQRLPPRPPTDAQGRYTEVVMPDWTKRAAWRGTYDVVTGTNTSPWENGERMDNVLISPAADYKDPRPFVWLPSRRCAEIWKTYAATGAMPPRDPSKPISIVNAFTRFNWNDVPASSTAAAPLTEPRDASKLKLWVTFDRAVAGAKVTIDKGGATLDGAPVFWSNIVIVGLDGVTDGKTTSVRLSDVKPRDGGAPLAAVISLRKLAGDVNGDGTVDGADLEAAQKLAGKKRGEKGYDLRADVNGDAIIDAADEAIIKAKGAGPAS